MRAVIVAAGDLDELPAEVQTVANTLSAAGWTVRLCLGDEATRAGLLRVAGEGPCDLAWLGLHSSAAGFGLADGAWPAAQAGMWLHGIGAGECVLNACYSLEHVEAIQRAADVGVAATIDPAGVDSSLAWQVGVHLVRAYVAAGDMQEAVRQASGFGSVQYRYIPRPARGNGRSGGRRMSSEDQRLLEQLVNAIKGDGMTGVGLIAQWRQLSDNMAAFVAEQRRVNLERERIDQEHDARLRALESLKPVTMTERSAYIAIISVAAVALLLLVAVILLNGGLR